MTTSMTRRSKSKLIPLKNARDPLILDSSTSSRRRVDHSSFVSHSLPIPRLPPASLGKPRPRIIYPLTPCCRPRRASEDPPALLLPPSPPVFSQTELLATEEKRMSADYFPRSAPSNFSGFNEMGRSLRERNSMLSTLSPLIESNYETDEISHEMDNLQLGVSVSSSILSAMQSCCSAPQEHLIHKISQDSKNANNTLISSSSIVNAASQQKQQPRGYLKKSSHDQIQTDASTNTVDENDISSDEDFDIDIGSRSPTGSFDHGIFEMEQDEQQNLSQQ